MPSELVSQQVRIRKGRASRVADGGGHEQHLPTAAMALDAGLKPLQSISKLRYTENVPWRVEILNETVAAEIAALPADMQARFLRLAEHIGQAGLESLSEPHVKHLEGKLWELRLTGRDGIARALYVTAIGRRVVVVRAFVKKTQKTPRAEIELALRRAKEIT